MGKVGTGIPGFGDSEGSKGQGFKPWKGWFLCKITEASAKDVEVEGEVAGSNVKVETVVLDGDEQGDGSETTGKKKFWFINVSYDEDRAFTVGYLKDLFNAAGVRPNPKAPNEPPYEKLAGKKIAVNAWIRVDTQGTERQAQKFVKLADSKYKDQDED
jgi:hypothetical protein